MKLPCCFWEVETRRQRASAEDGTSSTAKRDPGSQQSIDFPEAVVLDVEEEMHHIAILDHIRLSLNAHLACFL